MTNTQINRRDIDYPIDGYCDPRFERVAEAFRRNFSGDAAEWEVGACVAVYHLGRPVVDLWGGYLDEDCTTPWRRDTLVNMMSVGKGIGAMCIHLLAERGELDLDAPVVKYWPEFAQSGKEKVLVRHVLDHRAGVPIVDDLWPGAIYDQDAMAEALAKQEPALVPGQQAGYHVLTFGFLLNEIARRVCGRTVGQILREDVAGPLDADYAIGLPERDLDRCAEFVVATEGTILDRAALPPDSLLSRIWDQTPPDLTCNEVEWRRSEIVSANGHGTARGVAKLYAAFTAGGLDGVCLWSPRTVARAISEQHRLVEQVMGRTYRQALGFVLDSPPVLWLGGQPRAFGHHGVGGSVGFGDPDRALGFGYAPNRQHQNRVDNGPRAGALIQALYESLAEIA